MMATKRVNRSSLEKSICKRRLDKLENEELQAKNDRFSLEEKKQLIKIYETHGFQAFQDISLIKKYIPNRTENDLIGLLDRLKSMFHYAPKPGDDMLYDWQKLCANLMTNFAKDKRVNIDTLIADSLAMACERLRQAEINDRRKKIDNLEILSSFSRLLAGKFPEKLSAPTACASIRLYNHINQVVDSSEIIESLDELKTGSWLKEATDRRLENLESAKKSLSIMMETNELTESNCSALLELPKIKRMTEFLNPLRLDIDGIIEKF